jgi:hypothetical protein
MGTVITLKNVRASFLTLGSPEYFGGKKTKDTDKARWSATGLVAYDDPQIKIIDSMIEEVAKAKWEKTYRKVLDNILADPKACFKVDGKRKDYAGYEGHWALTAHRNEEKGRPVVIDTDKSPIYKPNGEIYEGKGGRVYSGCYINLQIELWAQDNSNGKAIRATLLALQRNRDGDAFSGGAAPDTDAFEEITEGTDADDLG